MVQFPDFDSEAEFKNILDLILIEFDQILCFRISLISLINSGIGGKIEEYSRNLNWTNEQRLAKEDTVSGRSVVVPPVDGRERLLAGFADHPFFQFDESQSFFLRVGMDTLVAKSPR